MKRCRASTYVATPGTRRAGSSPSGPAASAARNAAFNERERNKCARGSSTMRVAGSRRCSSARQKHPASAVFDGADSCILVTALHGHEHTTLDGCRTTGPAPPHVVGLPHAPSTTHSTYAALMSESPSSEAEAAWA